MDDKLKTIIFQVLHKVHCVPLPSTGKRLSYCYYVGGFAFVSSKHALCSPGVALF